jgi:hypothetical protein
VHERQIFHVNSHPFYVHSPFDTLEQIERIATVQSISSHKPYGFRMAIQVSSLLLGSLLLQYVHDWGAPLCVVIEPSAVKSSLYPMWYKSVDKFLESGKRIVEKHNTLDWSNMPGRIYI